MDKLELQKRIINYYSKQSYCFSDLEKIHKDENWKRSVSTVNSICDFWGYKTVFAGAIGLAVFTYGDDLTDEAVIGKCRLLLDSLATFKKYALKFGWRKLPITACVYFIFYNSDKAFHFRNSVINHCKFTHNGLLGSQFVLPFGIDTSAKSVWGQKTLISFGGHKYDEMEAAFFS